MSGPRTVRAPRGTALTCRNWLSEAAYRMIQNNLDPESRGKTGGSRRLWRARKSRPLLGGV